jgi:hypothetical protein
MASWTTLLVCRGSFANAMVLQLKFQYRVMAVNMLMEGPHKALVSIQNSFFIKRRKCNGKINA